MEGGPGVEIFNKYLPLPGDSDADGPWIMIWETSHSHVPPQALVPVKWKVLFQDHCLTEQVLDISPLTHKNHQEHNKWTESILSSGPLFSSSLQKQLS